MKEEGMRVGRNDCADFRHGCAALCSSVTSVAIVHLLRGKVRKKGVC